MIFKAVLTYAVARGVALTFWRRLLPEKKMTMLNRLLKQLYFEPMREALEQPSIFVDWDRL